MLRVVQVTLSDGGRGWLGYVMEDAVVKVAVLARAWRLGTAAEALDGERGWIGYVMEDAVGTGDGSTRLIRSGGSERG